MLQFRRNRIMPVAAYGGGVAVWPPLADGAQPDIHAEFNSEGVTDRFWYNAARYLNEAALRTASSGAMVRASAALRGNTSGLLESLSNNILRFDHDPTGTRANVTNLCLRSEALDNATWTKGSTTVSVDAVAAPDGATTADKVIETTANSGHYVIQAITIPLAPITWSIFAKAAERAWVWISIEDGVTGKYTLFNLSGAGSIGSLNQVGSGARITALANGWYRISITYTPAGTVGQMAAGVATGDGDFASLFYVGDVTKGAYFWGAQLVQSSSPESYIPTTTATVTRSVQAPTGVLLERTRTNILLRSNEFDHAYWTKNRASVVAAAAVSPDGATNAYKLVEDATATQTHRIFETATVISTNTDCVTSVYLKAAERTWAYVRGTISGFGSGANFNLSAGTIGVVDSGITASILAMGNGWYRCIIRYNSGTSTTQQAYVGLATGNNATTYSGDGTSGIYIYGAQCEAGLYSTSYVPTTTVAVARAADSYTRTRSNPTTLGVVVSGKTPRGVATQVLWQADDGTENNLIRLLRNTSNEIRLQVVAATVSQADVLLGTVAADTAFKAAIRVGADDFHGALNGALAASPDVSGSMPTGLVNNRIGANSASANQWDGHVGIYSEYVTMTNAAMQSLTT